MENNKLTVESRDSVLDKMISTIPSHITKPLILAASWANKEHFGDITEYKGIPIVFVARDYLAAEQIILAEDSEFIRSFTSTISEEDSRNKFRAWQIGMRIICDIIDNDDNE